MSIFDQIGKIASNSGAQKPSGQTGGTYLTELEQAKDAASQKLSDLYLALGKAYYASHSDDHQTEYESQLTAIRDAHEEIAKCKQQVEEIAARKRCPACGAQLVEGSVFCNICGTKLPDAPSSAEQGQQDQKVCPQCQAAIGPDDVFCTACGADLRK